MKFLLGPLPAVLMLGIVSQIGQVLILRELLMVFHGNELTLGIILASWLLWVGIGSRLVVTIIKNIKSVPLFLFINSTGLLLVLPATLLIIRHLRGIFEVLPGAYLSLPDMLVSCFLVLAPACLMLGAQFVTLSKFWRQLSGAQDTIGAEKTYVGEAAGNMLGGILFTFLLVHFLNPFQTAILAGFLMIAALLPVMKFVTSNNSKPYLQSALAVIALILAFLILFPVLEGLDQWAHQNQWEHFAPDYELLETRQSPHGNISVVQHQDQYSFYQSGHLVFSTAGPETTIPGLEEEEAVSFANLALTQHQDPQRVLLIGGGFRGTLEEILRNPVEQVDYIELDEELTRAALQHLPADTTQALEDPRVNLIHGDGRLYTKTAEKKYDLVILDTPDPFTAEVNRYYTKEFFQEIKNILKPAGVLVTETTSTPDLRGTAIANRNATLYHTLNQVFPRVLPAGEQTTSYFASLDPEQVTLDPSNLEKRYLERDVAENTFSPARFYSLLEESQLQRINWILRNHGRTTDAHLTGPGSVPPLPGPIEQQEKEEKQLPAVEERYFVNTDLNPIGYYYSLNFWENLTRDEHPFSLQKLLQVESWWIIPLACLPLLASLGMRVLPFKQAKRANTHFALLFTAFSTGLSTMSLQVALLFAFQGIYGFVYEMVGLITAMFMCGLALGALLTHRRFQAKANVSLLAGMQLFMCIWATAIAYLLPEAALLESLAVVFAVFSFLTFSAGFINGIDFPLTAACYLSLQKPAEQTTGAIYGTELLGACLGATVTSVLVAPVFGIKAGCLLASIASGTAFLVLLLAKRG